MDQALEASFISKIPNSAVNSWAFDQIKSSFQAVNDQNLPALSAKVDTSTIQSWTAAQITSIASVSDSAFQTRLASSFPVETCSWAELSQFANAVPTSALSSYVGKEKTYGSTTFVIIGVGHDNLTAGGKAALTLMGKQQFSSNISMLGQEQGANYMETDYYPTLGEDIKPYIKQVTKGCNVASHDNLYGTVKSFNWHCWEISAKEATNERPASTGFPNDGSTLYQYFSGSDAAEKRKNFGINNTMISNGGKVVCRGASTIGNAHDQIYISGWEIETGKFPYDGPLINFSSNRAARCPCFCI